MMYLIKVSIITIILYLVYHYAFKHSTHHWFNRIYLLAASLLSFLLPLINIPVYPQYFVLNNLPTVVPDAQEIAVAASFWNGQNILMLIYSIGVIVSLFIIGNRLRHLLKIIRQGQKENAEGYVKVYTNSNISLSSFMNFLIVPDSHKDQLTPYQLNHEEHHIRQRHSLDILLVEFLKAILWFNPIMFLYKKRLVEVHEYLADAGTLKILGKTAYEDFLIKQVVSKNQPLLVHNFYSLFKQRIHMMNSNAKAKVWQYLLILPALLFCLFLFSFKSYPVYQSLPSNPVLTDTIPDKNLKEIIDTVVTFYPETMEETVQYVKTTYSGEPPHFQDRIAKSRLSNLEADPFDTITIFDPATFKETVIQVNNVTGVVDTLKIE